MESTKHPDQNPEEAIVPNQEENSQPEAVLSTAEQVTSEKEIPETAAEITVAEVVESEPIVTVQPEAEEVAAVAALSEPEVVAEKITEPEAAEAEAPAGVTEVSPVEEVASAAPAEVPTVEAVVAEPVESAVEGTPEPGFVSAEVSAIFDETIEEEAAVELAVGDLSLLTREQLVVMLEEIVHSEDVNEIKSKVAQIKVAYLALANKERHEMYQNAAASEEAENFEIVDPLEDRYKAAFAIYRQHKNRYTEDQEKIKVQNLDAKKKILDELKALVNSEETLKKTYDEFKALQEQWKGIGMVPKTEAQGLWQNYHFLIEKFFDKVKINKELKDLDLRKNLERKMELCEKAEELVLEPSIAVSFKRLQELHEEWKEVGPVAQDKRDEVWDRFKTATEKINDRRHEFYNRVQKELEANFAAKELLCEKAEQIVAAEYTNIKQWQDSTHQVNELLKMWKSLGQAPQKVSNDIWTRFKTQLDLYFGNKKEYFGKIKDEQQNNYNQKVELCLQAEAHRLSTDWKNSSHELIRLQEEWKKIGAVPRKHSEKIWKRFRSACDDFFNTKNEYFKNIQANEGGNLQIKQDILAKLIDFEFSENRQESLGRVKEFQRQWMETGHVPIKEKDRLQTEYKAAVDKIYEKLKVDSQEASRMNYRSRFENVKDQPDAGRIINRERTGLQAKIDSLKEEILLWENNIGFFSRSKQATLLKTEFEGKIARAKEELASLEAKAKILRNVAREQQ
jgi:hypothetical protein